MKKKDMVFLHQAIELSKKCVPISTAFCVGAVIVDTHGKIITTGYSRETDQHKHAEEIAIEKAFQKKINLTGSTLYSSLEPCGERLSGRKTCVQWIIETGIKRVIFAVYEPPKFVKGKGEELLQKAGVETFFLETGDTIAIQ
jgi:pyrimidine deaminase RibD-like protein